MLLALACDQVDLVLHLAPCTYNAISAEVAVVDAWCLLLDCMPLA